MARMNRCKGESRRDEGETRRLKQLPISILTAGTCRGQTAGGVWLMGAQLGMYDDAFAVEMLEHACALWSNA
jgi:hypothetical protein